MNAVKICSKLNAKLEVQAVPGHFATSHSHNSFYIDITRIKHEHTMAREAAITLAQHYAYETAIDTIVCLDGSEVVGAFLARHLAQKDRFAVNSDKNINVVSPEYDSNGQLLFRANLTEMVTGKSVLILISTVNSGKTIRHALKCMRYYGAQVKGIATMFSTVDQVDEIPVCSVFRPADIAGYVTSTPEECPMCKQGQKIDALANSFGLSYL